ncbi:hypothetical protein AB0B74_17950 [Micromonospora parva]|uniref:imine reductase family protein n=1 Tax=Micromonospora parva TaxID=1464048 RepID=UPI0033FCC794
MIPGSSRRSSPKRRRGCSWSAQLRSGDYTKGVVSPLAMQVAGTSTFLSTAEQQGVSPELLRPYFDLMRRRLAQGGGEEDLMGVIDLLVR